MKANINFFIASRPVLLKMRNFSQKSYREIQNMHFICNIFFFENRAVCEIMWNTIVEPGRPKMTWRMRIACWIPNATNTHTHSEYVLLIAFLLQQWLHEHTSMLGSTYSACLVSCPPRVTNSLYVRLSHY